MYFRDMKCEAGQALMSEVAILRLPLRIGGRDPGEAVAGPVSRRLEKRGLAQVSSWRVWTEGEGHVRGIEFTLTLAQPTRPGLLAVADALRQAPAGSSVRFSAGGDPVVFGGSEAVEVTLPRSDHDTRGLAEKCARSLGRRGTVRGWSSDATATRLFIYGPEASAIVSGIQTAIGDVPMRPSG